MGDGVAPMAGPSESLFVKYMRPGLRNTSTKIISAGSVPLRPSDIGTTTYIALRRYADIIYHHAQLLIATIQSKNVWGSSWLHSLSILLLGAAFCFTVMYIYATIGQRHRKSPHHSVISMNGGKQYEQDSDDFDYEDDSDEESGQQSGLTPIRRFLGLRKNNRPGSSNKSAGIVRITSSDPRSSLSSIPIQLDMDSKTAVTPSEALQDPSIASLMQHSASVARRRRESGRLLNGVSTGNSASRTISPLGRSSPSRKTGSLTHSASPSRPPRAPRIKLYTSGQESMSDTDLEQTRTGQDVIVPSSSSQTFDSAGAGFEEDDNLASMVPISILVRQPQIYARKANTESSPTSHDLYSLNRDASGSAVWQNSPIESGSDFGYGLHLPPPTTVGSRRLPPGAGHAPSSPLHSPGHKLGSMDPSQNQAYWLERKSKSIRLKEPDWSPYVDVHIRAKERLETAAHVAANPQSTMMFPPPLLFSFKLLGDSSPADTSEIGSGSQQSGGHLQSDPEEEFWFERFTQSTAAAGRDWDWRKRRRQREMAAAAKAKAEEEALSKMEGAGDSEILDAGNVGMTDVQLQKQRNEHARKTSQFTARPLLSIATNESSLSRLNGQTNTTAGPNGKQTSGSPFGRRLKRFASPASEGLAESPNEGEVEATAPMQNGTGNVKKSSKSPRKKHSRRQSENDADENDVSVPSRLSSLKPKLIKRGLGAKRERDADLTKQLLAEAEEVATDEEGEVKREMESPAPVTSFSPRGAFGLRKSASSPRIEFTKTNGIVETSPEPVESFNEDVWGAGVGAWSSADAYGSAPSPAFHMPLQSTPVRAAALRNTAAYLLAGGGGEELRRQGSKADSQGSNSSSTKDLPIHPSARSGSRKGILSSASRAANGDSPRRISSEEGIPMRASDSYNSLHNNSLPIALPMQ